MCGGADAVGVAGEVSEVEVELEDHELCEVLLHLPGEEGFLEFARGGFVVVEEDVFDDLLRDGGTAADEFFCFDVGDEAGADGADVEAVVGEEFAVFGGDEGVGSVARQVVEADPIGVFGTDFDRHSGGVDAHEERFVFEHREVAAWVECLGFDAVEVDVDVEREVVGAVFVEG